MLTGTGQMGGLEGARTQAQLGATGQVSQNIASAMQASPQLANLGMAPAQNYWQSVFAPLQAYGNIVGPPTVLGGGSSSSGWNVGIGGDE